MIDDGANRRMKMRRAHDVPLSRQALGVLREIWSLSDYGDLVVPSIRSIKKPLSENAMNWPFDGWATLKMK